MSHIEKYNPDGTITRDDVRTVIEQSIPNLAPDGKKVLLIIPDNTRTCPLNLVLSEINAALKDKVDKLDMLIALGTHAPLPQDEIYRYLQIDEQTHKEVFSKTDIFNHYWNDPDHLISLGTISGDRMRELSKGGITEAFDVTINKMIMDYDRLVVVGPVFPHEVMGFSGGNKYFFPGIAGQEIIDAFHWLGALITNREINGTIHTPVRSIVDHCVDMIDKPKFAFCLVNSREGLHGMFAGMPEAAYAPAAEFSSTIHIKECRRTFKTVLSICPKMYDELWVGAKCMYKLEPVVEQGGTLIIYAPHIKEVSVMHGHIIKEIGYHTLSYFTAQMEKFKHIPGGVLAHSTHVKGTGTYVDGIETPDTNVILATGIPESVCKQINLGYIDPDTINITDYENREEDGILVVPHAGEQLHKIADE